MMKCLSLHLTILLILVMCSPIVGLKCYQCTTMRNHGCFYDLDESHLKECANRTKGEPVCRLLSQLQFFTPTREVAIVRECAYIYTKPLTCTYSKFGNMHYSLSCECSRDGCNRATHTQKPLMLIVFLVSVLVIK